jgi:hypothetical protein
MGFGRLMSAARRTGVLAVLFFCGCPTAFAAPIVDALIQTTGFNELTSYDAAQINNSDFFGFDANFVGPLNITNLLPQNSVVSIADSGSTVYGLIRTPGFNELTAYNRTQINEPDFFGFDAKFLAPLDFTNLLPPDSIVSISVSGDELYALVRTDNFNELMGYDLDQINEPDFFGFEPDFIAPLDITNLLPQNSIIAITVARDDGSGGGVGGGGGSVAAPEPSTYALMMIGMFALEAMRRGRRSRAKGKVAVRVA